MQVLSRKGKEDCPELLTVLVVILKENYLLDPCVVSSTRSGECRSSSSRICARANGPQNGRLPCWGSTRKSGALAAGDEPFLSTGGPLGLKLQGRQPGKGSKKEKIRKL